MVVVHVLRKKVSNTMPQKGKKRNYFFPLSQKVLVLVLKCFPLDGGNIFVACGLFCNCMLYSCKDRDNEVK